jgi:hypothetical protein
LNGTFHESEPLTGIEGTGGMFVSSASGPTTALWAWTPKATATVQVTAGNGELHEADLYGPFAELRTDLKWFVAFAPSDAQQMTATAFDGQGNVLWEKAIQLLRTLSVARAGTGDGEVLGFWTQRLDMPGPHPPTSIIDCGADCRYMFESPGGDFTLVAQPAAGSEFVGWTGPCAGQGATCDFELQGETHVTATFDLND